MRRNEEATIAAQATNDHRPDPYDNRKVIQDEELPLATPDVAEPGRKLIDASE